MTSGDNNFNCFAENQLTKFSARDAGDISDAAGARVMAPKCGSLPRDAGDLVGLLLLSHPGAIMIKRLSELVGWFVGFVRSLRSW